MKVLIASVFLVIALTARGALSYMNSFDHVFAPDRIVEAFTNKAEAINPFSFSPIIPDEFSFSKGGQIRINITVEGSDNAGVYVMLFRRDTFVDVMQGDKRELDPSFCLAPSLLRVEVDESMGTKVITYTVKDADLYMLRIYHCLESSTDTRVFGTAVLTNPIESFPTEYTEFDKTDAMIVPSSQMYLPAELRGVLPLYTTLIIIYSLILLFWISWNAHYWRYVRKLQLTLFPMLITKLLEVTVSRAYYLGAKNDGDAYGTLLVMTLLTRTLANITLLTTLLLVSLGFTVFRSNLAPREKQVVVTIFVLYFGVGVLQATCVDGVSYCGTYTLADYILRSVIMLATIVALNYNLAALKAGISGVNWMTTTQASYRTILMFYSFRWTYMAYLLLPTFGLLVNVALLSSKYEWAVQFIVESILAVLYVRFCLAFAPASTRPYNPLLRVSETIERGVPLSDMRAVARRRRTATVRSNNSHGHSNNITATMIANDRIAPAEIEMPSFQQTARELFRQATNESSQ